MNQDALNISSELVYAAVSANRHENNISCHNNYLLYSRCRCPVVYDLNTNQVTSFLIGHNDEVNGQCFISTDESISPEATDKPSYVISTSYDRTAIIWEISTSTTTNDEHHINRIDHKILYSFRSPINDVFTTRCSIRKNNQFMSITTTIDGSIYLWTNDELAQTLKTKYCCFDSKMHTITTNDDSEFIFIFLAGGDNKVHVFQLVNSILEPLFELTGHSDWIKCIDVLNLAGRQNLEFLLASASQDSFIRVWHMKLVDYDIDSSQIRTTVSNTLLSETHQDRLSASQKQFRLTATLETVLSGHEGIVHGLCWFKKQPEPILQLLSCSADKTIVLWQSSIAPQISSQQPEERQQLNLYDQCPASAGIWKESHRVGETGETNLPFLGVCLSNDELTFYSHSLRGAIHSWTLEDDKWSPNQTIIGHFEPVTDLSWEKSGAYLLSSSLDKTCRLHAVAAYDNRWHEVARPQVHGHEINCLVSLDFDKFATGAEEKTIRTFEATQFCMKNFKALTKTGVPSEFESIIGDLPVHAQLPALGLSNRGAQSPYDVEDSPNDKNSSGCMSNTWYGRSKLVEHLAQVDHLDTLPIEEVLLQSTLWWETNKLFGHSNELYSLAVNSSGSYLASASKANRVDLASIFVWECSKFRKVATLEHHTLTITRLRFSPNDRYILSVSRDRTWCISEQTGKPRPAYKKLICTIKSNAIHDRIIWDCCWTHDSKYFITVSRDKKAIVWSMDALHQSLEESGGDEQETSSSSSSIKCTTSKLFDCSIQAVDSPSCHIIDPKSYLFALGFENGSLELHMVSLVKPETPVWQHLKSFTYFHQLPIRRLSFQPTKDCKNILLASAGDDCIVKMTKINFNTPVEA